MLRPVPKSRISGPLRAVLSSVWLGCLGLCAPSLLAQEVGIVSGVVQQVDDASPLAWARVEVESTGLGAFTDDEGRFRIVDVPVGAQVLIVSWMSTGGQRVPIQVLGGSELELRIEYRPVPFALSEIIVSGGSRVSESLVEAPVAIAVADRLQSRSYSVTGQHPQVIQGLAGMDVSSNGIHDFNVNTRGFNADLSQRLLVLMDGRDLAIPFLAAQEWSALSLPLEDIARLEVVRGPGSALYGANAYNGVINILTPYARDVVGNKMSLAGGELATVRGDLRHASVFGQDERFGIRANVGFYRSRDWHVSRTAPGDLDAEYAAAVDTSEFTVNAPPPGFEAVPLNGQTTSGPASAAEGEPDPVQNVYGSARLDYYHPGGGTGTVEAGAARATNQVFMTNVGRFQVDHALRPWARIAWHDDRLDVMAWYSGRVSEQKSLASGAPIEEKSSILHVESQWNQAVLDGRVHLVAGGSYRRSLVDSRGTLVAPEDDARNDWASGAFGQVQARLTSGLSLVLAGRVDGSNLYDTQVSPKVALVYSPWETHSLRLSAGRAFQTPRMTNFFLNVPLGLPADLSPLEAALRDAFGPALSAVPEGTLFTQSAAVPALALGNPDLDVEYVTSYEVGYRGEVRERLQLSVDAYYSVVRDFVSALLPYANPALGPWTAPAAVQDPAVREALEDAVLSALGPASGLTRLNDASETTVIAYSYGNAGRATEWGVELSAAVEVTPRMHVEGNYTYFEYEVDAGVPLVPGDLIVPNTPRHKANVRIGYTGSQFDAWAGANVKTAHDWSSGFFQGRVPSSQRIDAGVGYLVLPRVRVHAVATNLLDEATYHIYGGSVDRRRILVGLTAYF